MFGDVVGMLRFKAPMVQELSAAITSAYSAFTASLRRSRAVQQEDEVLRLRAAGLLVQLGRHYVPSAGLLGEPVHINPEGSMGSEGTHDDADLLLGIDERERLVLCFGDFVDSEGVFIEGSSLYRGEVDRAELARRLDECRAAHALVLSEVRDEVCSVRSILEEVTRFRSLHAAQYSALYQGHSLVGLLDPLVAHDLLLPQPLPEDIDLSARPWFAPIQAFDDSGLASSSAGEQVRLLPRLVARVLLPWLMGAVRAGLDPLSSTQADRVARTLNQLTSLGAPDTLDPSAAAREVLHLYTREAGLRSICLPQVRLLESAPGPSLPFMTRQLDKCRLCVRNAAQLLPFMRQSEVVDEVWGVFADALLEPALRLAHLPQVLFLV